MESQCVRRSLFRGLEDLLFSERQWFSQVQTRRYDIRNSWDGVLTNADNNERWWRIAGCRDDGYALRGECEQGLKLQQVPDAVRTLW